MTWYEFQWSGKPIGRKFDGVQDASGHFAVNAYTRRMKEKQDD
jgi:hypothetical protein